MLVMKKLPKALDTFFKMVLFFVLNLPIASLCMLFLDINFRDCLIYSAINALWMPFVLPSILVRIKPIEFGDKRNPPL